VTPYGHPWNLFTVAACAKRPADSFEIVSKDAGMNSKTHKQASAVCPEGTVIVGGAAYALPFGFGIILPFVDPILTPVAIPGPVALQSSGPGAAEGGSTGDEWVAVAREMSPYDESWDVIATAFCATPANVPAGLEAVISTTPSTNDPAFQYDYATCPDGKVVIGGGVHATELSLAPGYSGVSGPVALQSNGPGTYFANEHEWAGIAREVTPYNGKWSLVTIAICAYP
jgi:hypothetical protein